MHFLRDLLEKVHAFGAGFALALTLSVRAGAGHMANGATLVALKGPTRGKVDGVTARGSLSLSAIKALGTQ